MINVLNVATVGLIDDMTPLSIATEGLITIPIPDDVVVFTGTGGGGGPSAAPHRFRIKHQMAARELERAIHADDEEVLAILVKLITTGALE